MEATAIRQGLTLSQPEIIEASGGYRQAARQLAELLKLGFHRATLDKAGRVRLERAHYEAVCSGSIEKPRPRLKPASHTRR